MVGAWIHSSNLICDCIWSEILCNAANKSYVVLIPVAGSSFTKKTNHSVHLQPVNRQLQFVLKDFVGNALVGRTSDNNNASCCNLCYALMYLKLEILIKATEKRGHSLDNGWFNQPPGLSYVMLDGDTHISLISNPDFIGRRSVIMCTLAFTLFGAYYF